MTTIRVKENEPFDVALRRFKRTIEKIGLLTELRAREFYEKPTAERKRKKAAAVKRHFKRVRSHAAAEEALLSLRHRRTDHEPARDAAAGFLSLQELNTDMSTLKDRITDDMKAAMRAKEAERLGTIRLLLAAMKQKRGRRAHRARRRRRWWACVDKLIKQRKDSHRRLRSRPAAPISSTRKAPS